MKNFRLFFCCFLIFTASLSAQETVLDWKFDKDRGHWTGANHIKDVQIKDGILSGKASGADPFFTADGFEFPTTNSQAIEFRYRTNRGGSGEVYYTNTLDTPYGGFTPKVHTKWQVKGDEQWHTARVFPGWNDQKKIIKLRIDFPNLGGDDVAKTWYEIDWIRVVDMNFAKAPEVVPDWDFTKIKRGWRPIDHGFIVPSKDGWSVLDTIESDPMTVDVDKHGYWISLEMIATHGKTGKLTFYSDTGKATEISFPIQADGKSHWYNIDGTKSPNWSGKLHMFRLTPSDAGTNMTVETFDSKYAVTLRRMLISDKPQGPAEISIEQVYMPEAINRTGKPVKLAVRLRNDGGWAGKNLTIGLTRLIPAGLTAKGSEPFDIEPAEVKTVTLELLAEKPMNDVVSLMTPAGIVNTVIRIDANLNLPKADYVPKPQPVESDYEIGALYYPGWSRMASWERIYSTHPERKPVLGWYDEGNPEVVDWQIKWSLENGIQYYLVDWYWHKGHRHNEHWIKAFEKARYKSMFKWAMMWANHNAAGSHSEEDQRTVTKFWIENYFNTPEYYTRDGRPVVMIWSPQNMDRDMVEIEAKKGKTLKKGEGLKRLLDLSQQMAKDAGFKGIYFIAMKWPEASTNPEDIQWLKDAGFDMTSIYHFMSHGGKAKNPSRFDFQLVVDASLPYFEARQKTGILPFLPNLSTGWDSRPWHGDRQTIIENRTVDRFRKICEDFKGFADRNKIRDLVLAPTNEWGEGSYAEPNAEHGFGMFETVRETFCKKPAGGWPLNFGPTDVGLGPYDFPPIVRERRTSWDFTTGVQGWSGFMGVRAFKTDGGVLSFETTNHDPAMTTNIDKIKAEDFDRFVVRMKATALDGQTKNSLAQLFWSTVTSPVSEANSISVPVNIDGQFHDYVFDLKSKPTWRRLITGLRFDPLGLGGVKVEIESLRLEK